MVAGISHPDRRDSPARYADSILQDVQLNEFKNYLYNYNTERGNQSNHVACCGGSSPTVRRLRKRPRWLQARGTGLLPITGICSRFVC
ncbi:hypothetical protein AAC387_Pa06g0594 [Persea americana]